MRPLSSLLLAMTAMTVLVAPAHAQNGDIIVMRKVMPELEPPSFPGKWTAGDWTWSAGAQTCSDAAVQTRSYYCMQNGVTVPEARCKGTAPRAEQKAVARYDSCTYSWTKTAQSAWNKTCSDTASRTLYYECHRTGGDSAPLTVPNASCGKVPDLVETGSNYEGCTYEWRATGYGSWASTCSDSTTRSVTYACRRVGGDAAPIDVAATQCGKAPGATETASNYAGCTYGWARRSSGTWSGDKCVASSTRTIDWGCQRSGGQSAMTFVPVDQEYMCSGKKPAATENGGSCSLFNGTFDSGTIVNGDAKVGQWSTRGNGSGWNGPGVTGTGGYIRIGAGAGGYWRQFLEQTVKVTAGTTYRFTFTYKSVGYPDPVIFGFYNQTIQLPRSAGWTTVTYDFKAPGTASPVVYFAVSNINSTSSTSEFWIDDVSMEVVG